MIIMEIKRFVTANTFTPGFDILERDEQGNMNHRVIYSDKEPAQFQSIAEKLKSI